MNNGFPIIEVIAKRGTLPYLHMAWPKDMTKPIREHLSGRGVKVVRSLQEA